jgi:hypothetical protein
MLAWNFLTAESAKTGIKIWSVASAMLKVTPMPSIILWYRVNECIYYIKNTIPVLHPRRNSLHNTRFLSCISSHL